MHVGEREVLGVESKKRRVNEPEVDVTTANGADDFPPAELETEEDLRRNDPEELRAFEARMAPLQYPVDRSSAAWPPLMREVLVRRLREPQGRGGVEEELDEAVGAGEPVGEDGSGEGRRVRYPTPPYVPTENERRAEGAARRLENQVRTL